MRKLLFAFLLTVAPLLAQNGDRPGESQTAPIKESDIPPAPILSPADSLKSFKLQPGFKIELVASEPLIEAPVAMCFHPNGAIYVLEMRGFMPTVDGVGEDQRVGRISILQDTNSDGQMDRSTIFIDGLLMPRAIGLAYDGVLVGEPPNIWFCKDTNNDGVSDEKTLIASDYGSQGNPEHTANGFLWAMDNWIYSANHTNRLRRVEGKWIQEPSAVVPGRGQWGLTQDDFGRIISNSNSDYLRGDLAPSELMFRNPSLASPFGVNVQFDKDQQTFPIRPNPGVNRAYEKGHLRGDGTLASFTAACGPLIYRGDQFDPAYYGSAFVCEPSANFIRCSRLTEKDGVITATNAFPKSEFLASTEERFRPVNLYNGPDGALYIVDMHRGVLQHRIYLTTYLRNQYSSRALERPLDYGRIYRVVQEGRPRRKIAPLLATTLDLIASLDNPNGWHRDTAQRLLVERSDPGALEPLRGIAGGKREDASPVHALWTLHGMEKLDSKTVMAALSSRNPYTRATAARMAGALAVSDALVQAAADSNPLVQLHATFSLGSLAPDLSALSALAGIVERHSNEQLFRDAAISGLRDKEITFAEYLFKRPAWQSKTPGFEKFLLTLTRAAALSKPGAVNRILELAVADKSWRRDVLLDGILNLAPKAAKGQAAPKPKPLRLDAEPPALEALKKEPLLSEKVSALETLLTWPGKAGFVETAVKPLTAREKEQFELGKQTYTLTCAACHQPHGLGQDGLAPPLVDSDWVTGSEQRLAKIILQGMRGPVTVNGKQYSLEMPPLGILEDQEIAAIMTYVRREWNHTASPVTTEFVTKIRAENSGREEPWTEEDLLKAP